MGIVCPALDSVNTGCLPLENIYVNHSAPHTLHSSSVPFRSAHFSSVHFTPATMTGRNGKWLVRVLHEQTLEASSSKLPYEFVRIGDLCI